MTGPVRAVCFDLDDTLVDGGAHREAIRRTSAEIAARIGLDAEQVLEANAEAWRRYWPQVEEPWMLGRIPGEAVTQEAWRRTLLECGRDDEALARCAKETQSELPALLANATAVA